MIRHSKQSMSRVKTVATIAMAWTLACAASVVGTMAADAKGLPKGSKPVATTAPGAPIQLDRSGKKRTGKASFYADRYSGKTMADGTPMRLYSNNAASITLPLGTIARVTNLDTGRSAVVTIRDRGPYVRGRIVDLSPGTARKIGLGRHQGLAQVEVLPLTVPQSDGTVKVMTDAVALASN